MNVGKLGVFAVIVVLLVVIWGMGKSMKAAFIPEVTQDESIGMVQPKGFWWSADLEQKQAENNLTNSEAGLNNSVAHMYDAQATAIITDADTRSKSADYAYQNQNNSTPAGQVGMFQQIMWSLCSVPGIVIGGLVMVGLFIAYHK